MKSINDAIDKMKEQIQVLEIFALKYGSKLPDDFPGHVSTSGTDRPSFGMICRDRYTRAQDAKQNRDKLLSVAGDVFGRDGWKRELSYDRDSYHWIKDLDGVALRIVSAEMVDDPGNGTPVIPSAFPLLILDRQEEQENWEKAPDMQGEADNLSVQPPF